jgi:hypothetical protein
LRRASNKLVWLLAGVACAAPALLLAQGEHARRAGAELQVLIADTQLLMQEQVAPKRAKGLRHRIAGMLSALPVLLRLADQERGRDSVATDVGELRGLLSNGGYAELVERLQATARSHPFHARHLLNVSPSLQRMRQVLGVHRQLCAACHDFPFLETERPALDLYREAKSMPPETFAARMVIGIRGDVVTGLGNPFTDEELGVLIALYQRAQNSADAERLHE